MAGAQKDVALDAISQSIVDRVTTWVEREGVLRAGEPMMVACSGGGDSTALLAALAWSRRWPLLAVYVDHGLRSGTEQEAALVARHAERLGVQSTSLRVEIERRGNLMAAARRARYRALALLACRRGVRVIAVGHTATDQAETVLFRMLRGDPLQALAGMPRRRAMSEGGTAGVELLRPLLDVRRSETRAWVRQLGLEIVDDPTNEAEQFSRTRIRRALSADPQLESEIEELSGMAAEWMAELDREAAALGSIDSLPVAGVAEAGPDVVLRLLRRAGVHHAGAAQVASLLRLAESQAGSSYVDLGGGMVAERRYAHLRIGDHTPDPGDLLVAVVAAGALPWLGGVVEIGCDRPLPPGLWLRNLRPGDRLLLRGGHRKLQDLWTDLKVPRFERRRLPLLAGERGDILWVGGSPPILASDGFPDGLRLRYHPCGTAQSG